MKSGRQQSPEQERDQNQELVLALTTQRRRHAESNE